LQSSKTAPARNWASFLTRYQANGIVLFSEEFISRWGDEQWNPTDEDCAAAGKLHNQITSRIATQRLGYLDGVEKTALLSLYVLFEKTREIVDAHPKCHHFETIAWHVLNTHVRPFTAKWHQENERGLLSALDMTDEFRGELADLQKVLQRFDDLLLHIRDNKRPRRATSGVSGAEARIVGEMGAKVQWGIPISFGGIDPVMAGKINEAERKAVRARRQHYKLPENDPHATGLALSGGGIRSATFSLGVLIALARRDLLPQFDYLSTVSGGGYIGSFLSAILQSKGRSIGLRPTELPFQREEGEAVAIRHIRHHSRYLAAGSSWQDFRMVCAQLWGMVLNIIAIGAIVAFWVVLERFVRSFLSEKAWKTLTIASTAVLVLGSLVALLASRRRGRLQDWTDDFVAFPAALLLFFLFWRGLGTIHDWFREFSLNGWTWESPAVWLVTTGAILMIASALVLLSAGPRKAVSLGLLLITSIAAPMFLFCLYLVIYRGAEAGLTLRFWGIAVEIQWIFLCLSVLILAALDVNFTSPHRHFRNRLSKAFLIQRSERATQPDAFQSGVSVLLSRLGSTRCAPYHLINCALNVPGSQNPRMQGRLAEFFLLSPGYSGSPLTGYYQTTLWEEADGHLDLGTAMAISGAAAAPQMGLLTIRRFSFWLALLNIRLGYWA